jgi:hypothetical protein
MKRTLGRIMISALVLAGSVVGTVGLAAGSAAAATPTPAVRAHVHHAQKVHGPVGAVRHGAVVGKGSHLVVPSKWSVVPSPNNSALKNDLYAISCTSVSFCMAVGYLEPYGPGNDTTLIEEWNGSTWKIVPSPNVEPTASVGTDLNGVDCVTTSYCVAVGYSYDNPNPDTTVIEVWNGTAWKLVTSPNPVASGGNDLYGITCTSLTFCMAVGETYDAVGKPLVTTFNGSTWKVLPTVDDVSGNESWLNAVSCTTPAYCVTVGVLSGTNDAPIGELWRGASATHQVLPYASANIGGDANSVSCASTTFCVMAGYQFDNTIDQNLIDTWNGSSWSYVPAAVDGTAYGAQEGVSCTGPTSCTSVGYEYTTGSYYVTTAVNWNGSSWSFGYAANSAVDTPGSDYSYLGSVDCIAGQECVAVGQAYPGDNSLADTLVETAPIARPGYRLVASDGGVFTYGGSSFNGSAGSLTLNKPIVGMAATPDGGGYWLVASDGGVFSYGDAAFYGSTGAIALNAPIVGMASTPNGGGYWLVAADGGIFAFGNAGFFGSAGSLVLNKPIVGMAATPSGQGYWLVASDGGIFSYGDATFKGSTGSLALNKPIVGMTSTPSGTGYWLVAADGGIFSFGAPFAGSAGSLSLNKPIVGMAAAPSGTGYWLVASDGGIFNYGAAAFDGSAGGTPLNSPVVGMAA